MYPQVEAEGAVLGFLWAQAKRIAKPDRIIPRIRIQVGPAREPDGILGEQAPASSALIA